MNMQKRCVKRMQRAFFVSGIFCFFVFMTASVAQAGDKGPARVGMETCITCHDQIPALLAETKHKILLESDTGVEGERGCEACHGPGENHLEDQTAPGGILKFREATADQIANACINCHETNGRKSWHVSTHSKEGLSCLSCHKIKCEPTRVIEWESRSGKALNRHLKEDQPELCLVCHTDKRAEINMPSHHPLKEGKIGCSDCHNPHENSDKNVSKAGTVGCVKCHQEKAGPFVEEHAPVTESCLECHKPHGSVNDNLLTVRPPGLCYQCHVIQPFATDNAVHLSAGCQTSNCHSRHQAIHGSNDLNSHLLNY